MRVLLMHPDRDFDLQQPLPRHDRDLTQDLGLGTIFKAMAGDDTFILDVVGKAILTSCSSDIETILYRHDVLRDCLQNPEAVRELYRISVETMEKRKKQMMWGFGIRHPGGILRSSIDLMAIFVAMLRKLRQTAEAQAPRVRSAGLVNLFAMLQRELRDEYLMEVEQHLDDLKFDSGVLFSAQPGEGNGGTDFIVREDRDRRPKWKKWLFGATTRGYTFHIPERDEAGHAAIGELRDRSVNLVANALAQSSDHILSFFQALRTEVAFYTGCVNLHERLTALPAPVTFPEPHPPGSRVEHFTGLYDVSLALTMGRAVVPNDASADGKDIVIVTGANEGGKTTFLRSAGIAQLMMQSGMFVGAASFAAELCTNLFTHFKREEDLTMRQGKLDEELARISEIVDAITPDALLLFNESFGSTNEREGSEIARQIVAALLEKKMKIIFVTHLYDFARSIFERRCDRALFLRAERRADGTRTFRLVEGDPLDTSYGADLYREIFGNRVSAPAARIRG